VFRGKFISGLKRLFCKNQLQFFGACQHLSDAKVFQNFLRALFRQDWVVYAKQPFGGPEHVLHYLARYTHRVAISRFFRLYTLSINEWTFFAPVGLIQSASLLRWTPKIGHGAKDDSARRR